MYINPELFDECFCANEGIGRVCLNGSKGIPKELEDIGREEDGDNYMESCFSINVFIENGEAVGGMINYMGENNFIDCLVCDNYKEAWGFYLNNATQTDINETLGK